MDFEFVNQKRIVDERGSLNLLESLGDLPFSPKRLFWVSGVPIGSIRGLHAHKTGHQLLYCLQGEILLTLKRNGDSEAIVLSEHSSGVWMKNMTWAEQKFLSEGAMLLVLASNVFDESDYIRNYEEFLHLTEQGF